MLLGSSIWRILGKWSFSVYLRQQPFYLGQSVHSKWSRKQISSAS
jgi:peptidoglycan/LPS O-acetylase OafA/YrhL